jgi:molybdate transport system substrate-binding protein
MIPRSILASCGWAGLFIALAGCSTSEPSAQQPAASTPETKPPITISVAASTKDAIAELTAAFKAKSNSKVQINSGPTNVLANQILEGAPVDLFLSANRLWAEKLEKPGHTAESLPLLTNKLVLIVPKGNPAGVRDPADLLKENVKRVALAGESVPAGMYAQQALEQLKLYEELVKVEKIARGQDVRSTLSYVERGEAEAGIVYSTDVRASKGVETVYEFDPEMHDEIAYVLVLLRQGKEKPSANEFYEYLKSAEAESIWRKFGFERLSTATP